MKQKAVFYTFIFLRMGIQMKYASKLTGRKKISLSDGMARAVYSRCASS